MKNVKCIMLVMLVVLSVASFGLTTEQITQEMMLRSSDSLQYLSFNTKLRTSVSGETLITDPYHDFSTMTMFFNTRTGDGWCADETETMSSSYVLSDIKWYDISASENNGNSGIMVSGVMTSDAGNVYLFHINDALNTISMIGLNSVYVIRKYYNIEATIDDVSAWKDILDLN